MKSSFGPLTRISIDRLLAIESLVARHVPRKGSGGLRYTLQRMITRMAAVLVEIDVDLVRPRAQRLLDRFTLAARHATLTFLLLESAQLISPDVSNRASLLIRSLVELVTKHLRTMAAEPANSANKRLDKPFVEKARQSPPTERQPEPPSTSAGLFADEETRTTDPVTVADEAPN